MTESQESHPLLSAPAVSLAGVTHQDQLRELHVTVAPTLFYLIVRVSVCRAHRRIGDNADDHKHRKELKRRYLSLLAHLAT